MLCWREGRCILAREMSDTHPYNPLDLEHLGEAVARALLAQPVHQLPPNTRFLGSGIYAVYYTGSFPAYSAIESRNFGGEFEMPIYVGKGIPSGRRTGGAGFTASHRPDLYNRLVQHARTLSSAQNLESRDFFCQYLVVAPVWIPLAEEMLIRWFRPLWNTVVTGFGNNDPGSRRYTQQRSLWDVLHPGRDWASRCAENPRTAEDILAMVAQAMTRLEPGGTN